MRKLLLTLAVLSLAGCSDPKAASEKNFKAAMQNYLDTAYPRCYFTGNFPEVKADWDFAHRNAAMAALEKAGLLRSSEIEQQEKQMFSAQTRTVKRTSYELTEEGKKYYKPGVTQNLKGDSMGGICAGKAVVKSIGQFTEPAEMMGQKISRVNYEYTVTGLPGWAQSADLQKTLVGLQEDARSESSPVKGIVAMVLTNNGWVHEKMFSR